MKRTLITLMIILLSVFSFVGCDDRGSGSYNVTDVSTDDSDTDDSTPVVTDPEPIAPIVPEEPTVVKYTVTYSVSNANQIGTLPSDATEYVENANVIVASNTLVEVITANDGTEISKEFVGWEDEDDNVYFAGDSFSITKNTILYAVFSSTAVRGETVSGYVFYDKGSYSDGWRYIECAKSDKGSIRWWDSSITVFCNLTSANPNFYVFGAGRENTETIITKSGSLLYMASGIIHVPSMGGNDSWYLPSVLEQCEMWVQLKDYNIGNFKAGTYYWTSNDYDKDNAYAMYTNDPSETGRCYQRAKYSNNYYVRPIRYF